jgi:hypothetical protein
MAARAGRVGVGIANDSIQGKKFDIQVLGNFGSGRIALVIQLVRPNCTDELPSLGVQRTQGFLAEVMSKNPERSLYYLLSLWKFFGLQSFMDFSYIILCLFRRQNGHYGGRDK